MSVNDPKDALRAATPSAPAPAAAAKATATVVFQGHNNRSDNTESIHTEAGDFGIGASFELSHEKLALLRADGYRFDVK